MDFAPLPLCLVLEEHGEAREAAGSMGEPEGQPCRGLSSSPSILLPY